jgi:hypothetical protein
VPLDHGTLLPASPVSSSVSSAQVSTSLAKSCERGPARVLNARRQDSDSARVPGGPGGAAAAPFGQGREP